MTSARNRAFTQVVFDLDGTLLDTLEDLTDAVNWVCARHGCPTHSREAVRSFVGNGASKLMERALPAVREDPSLFRAVLEEYSRRYQAHSMDKTRPYAGLPEVLRELKARGIPMAVLSNKPDAAAGPLVEHYYPGLFTLVQGALPEYPTKPDPALLSRLLERLGGTREKTLFVGDSGVDMETARRGGLTGCGVLWGFRDEAELRACGAALLARRPEDLLELL